MSSPERLEILYLAHPDPLAGGWASLQPVLQCVLDLGPGLAPDGVLVKNRRRRWNPDLVTALLETGLGSDGRDPGAQPRHIPGRGHGDHAGAGAGCRAERWRRLRSSWATAPGCLSCA